jgi:flagellar biosynthesis regulator FlaF
MSLGIIVGGGVVIAAALIGAVSLLRSDRGKRKEARRVKGIETFRETRASWDQAQIVEVAESVRRQKLQEVRAGLVSIQLLVGSDLKTPEFKAASRAARR